jgi:hypothetical protein
MSCTINHSVPIVSTSRSSLNLWPQDLVSAVETEYLKIAGRRIRAAACGMFRGPLLNNYTPAHLFSDRPSYTVIVLGQTSYACLHLLAAVSVKAIKIIYIYICIYIHINHYSHSCHILGHSTDLRGSDKTFVVNTWYRPLGNPRHTDEDNKQVRKCP